MHTGYNAYKQALERNEKVLDQIDLTPYLEKYANSDKDIYDFMDEITHDYEDSELVRKHPFLDGDILYEIGKWEMQDYIKRKYGDKYQAREAECDPPMYIMRCHS